MILVRKTKKQSKPKAAKTVLSDETERVYTIMKILSRAWTKDPERLAVINEAKREYKGSNKRQKYELQCAECGQWFKHHNYYGARKTANVEVDHIIPKGSATTMEELGAWVLRLFCSRDNLQLLCCSCHKIKSKQDLQDMRNAKKS